MRQGRSGPKRTMRRGLKNVRSHAVRDSSGDLPASDSARPQALLPGFKGSPVGSGSWVHLGPSPRERRLLLPVLLVFVASTVHIPLHLLSESHFGELEHSGWIDLSIHEEDHHSSDHEPHAAADHKTDFVARRPSIPQNDLPPIANVEVSAVPPRRVVSLLPARSPGVAPPPSWVTRSASPPRAPPGL